jgi:glucose dehydrogenase
MTLASSVAALLAAPAISTANSGVEKLTQNPANWATALGNYAGTRYSELDQINAKNVKNLQPAWSFSTGVLRGHHRKISHG